VKRAGCTDTPTGPTAACTESPPGRTRSTASRAPETWSRSTPRTAARASWPRSQRRLRRRGRDHQGRGDSASAEVAGLAHPRADARTSGADEAHGGLMAKQVAVFWPVTGAHARTSSPCPTWRRRRRSSRPRSGRSAARLPIPGFLTSPRVHREARTGHRPMVGMFAHWVYGPHTTDGVVARTTRFCSPRTSAPVAGAGRPAQHRRLSRDGGARTLAHLDSVEDFTSDPCSWSGSTSGAPPARCLTNGGALGHAPVSADAAALAQRVAADIRARHPLILMLGDTSMGMINGYFGHGCCRVTASQSTRSTRPGSSTRSRHLVAAHRRRLRFREGQGRHLPLG